MLQDNKYLRLEGLLTRVRSMKERAKDLLDKTEKLKDGFADFVQEVQNDTKPKNEAV